MNRIDLDKNFCCGCAACANICTHDAITMTEDKRGFILPEIDVNKCVECGLCVKVCDFKKEKRTENNTLHAYSLIHNDNLTVRNSTSGGAFTALSDVVLEEGGLVVGAVMEDDFTIHHIITKDPIMRNKMRGSKYVQSAMEKIYGVIKQSLKDGKTVLFTGTPCQCAGIKSFFRDKYENLLIVDFLCHGVPNNKMFKEHIAFLEKQYDKRIVGYTFRDKRYGWNAYNDNNNNNADGSIGTRLINQAYYNFFLSNLSLRDSCFNCKYRSFHKPSDVTIADFWGIEKLTGKKNHTGVSMVLTHSSKGEMLVQKSASKCTICEYPFEQISYRIALNSAPHSKDEDAFWRTYDEDGYSSVVEKFFDNSLNKRIRYEVRKIAKKLRLC